MHGLILRRTDGAPKLLCYTLLMLHLLRRHGVKLTNLHDASCLFNLCKNVVFAVNMPSLPAVGSSFVFSFSDIGARSVLLIIGKRANEIFLFNLFKQTFGQKSNRISWMIEKVPWQRRQFHQLTKLAWCGCFGFRPRLTTELKYPTYYQKTYVFLP